MILPAAILMFGVVVYPFFYNLVISLSNMSMRTVNTWQIIAYSFILGGGVSNIYDRLLYGSVVDFMNMGIGTLRTGIFNFADVSIMIGLFMILPYLFKKPPPKANNLIAISITKIVKIM